MATSRSLGTLTIDLIAKIAGFEQGMTKAERTADKSTRKIAADAKRRAKETEEAWKAAGDGIGRALGLIGGALAGGAIFTKIAQETAQAQKEQALLSAALRSTGNAAGYSQERLNAMADALEATTTISAGDVNQAQTVLTGFVNIVGEQLPKALMAAADLSTRTGQTMAAAAETIGRALDVPSSGMASLQKQGFKFSESQIEAAKALERVGKVAEAQEIVLAALNETYGGAAVAARDTLGGAYTALQNTINSLLTGDGGSFSQLQTSINSLTNTLSSDSTRQAFVSFTNWLATLANTVVQTAATIANSGLWGWLSVSNAEEKDLQGTIATVSSHILKLKKQRAELDPSKSAANRVNDFIFGDVADLDRQIAVAESKLKGAQARLDAAMPRVPASIASSFSPDLTPRTVGSVNLKDVSSGKSSASAASSAAKAAAREMEREAESAAKYLATLKALATGRTELTAAEQVAYDVAEKKIKLDDQQLQLAQLYADEAEKRKDADALAEASLARTNDLFKEGASLAVAVQTPTEKWLSQVERLNELSAAGAVSQETYARAVKGYYEELTGAATDYAKLAGENIQNLLGDWLANGLDGSFKKILASFLQMLLKMEAQAAAANIMTLITGKGVGGGSPIGSIFGKIFDGIFGVSGTRENGGSVSPNSLYQVNENGPELLSVGGRDYLMMGGAQGYVTPNAANLDTPKRQAGGITIVNQTTGRIDKVEQKQLTPADVMLIISEQTPKIMQAQTQNANSPFSRTMQGSYNVNRRR